MVDPTQMVYLIDSNDCVISLPPLTNSENSKVKNFCKPNAVHRSPNRLLR